MSGLRTFAPSAFALAIWLVWVSWDPDSGRSLAYTGLSVAMLGGSLIAGSTPLGGGVVAFPVSSLAYDVPASSSRDFALLIQSVGMGTASLTLLLRGVPLPWRHIGLAATVGLAGSMTSIAFLERAVSDAGVKVIFASLTLAIGVVLCLRGPQRSSCQGPAQVEGRRAMLALVIAAYAGGLCTGLMGTGADFLAFLALTTVLGVSEQRATAASIVVMAAVSLGSVLWSVAASDGVDVVSVDMWRACIPIVVIGAPIGGLICLRLPRRPFLGVLLALATVQFASHAILMPEFRVVLATSAVSWLMLFGVLAWWRGRANTTSGIVVEPDNQAWREPTVDP